MNKIRIVLISDNRTRDYLALRYVKEELEKKHNFEVYIIGSIAELQRTYYLLYKIRPHIVFVSQVLEKCFRDVCSYVRRSHGIVIVLPSEITYSSSAEINLLNKNLRYNTLFDRYLVPGKKMRRDLMRFDIQGNKIAIVGSPKIDLLVKKWRTFSSRNAFLATHGITPQKRNIFIFTTFIKTPEQYILKDTAYFGLQHESIRLSRDMDKLANIYGESLSKLCKDFPQYNFILKPHPLESTDWYKDIHAVNFYVLSNEYIVNTMKSIDLAIHWYSTSAIECWVHHIKTIQYTPLPQYKSLLGEFHSGNPVVSSYQQLRRAVHTYMHNPLEKHYVHFQKHYISQWFGVLDGNCAKRITREVLTMIRRRPHLLPHYTRRHSYLIYPMLIVERLVGKTISRRLISCILPYNWKYASDNAICIKGNAY